MFVLLIQIIKLHIFRHGIEVMEAGQYKADAAITPAAAQDVHTEGGPEGMGNEIQQMCFLALLLHLFRSQRRVEIQFVEVMIPIPVRIVNDIFFLRQFDFFVVMMELWMHEARHIGSLGRDQTHHIIREPAAMPQGLLPEIIQAGIALSISSVILCD